MFNPWLAVVRDAMRLGIEAQGVVALRLAHLATSGPAGWVEARRMATEKIDALAKLQVAAAMSIWSGPQSVAIARKAISIYGKRVRANRRRLSRR